MRNRAQRIADEIRLQMGASVYESVIHAAGVLKPAPSPPGKNVLYGMR